MLFVCSAAHCRSLRAVGVSIPEATSTLTVSGFQVPLPPRVVLQPSFAPSLSVLQTHFPTPTDVHVSATSTLAITGGSITIFKLLLDGALLINAVDGAVVGKQVSYVFAQS